MLRALAGRRQPRRRIDYSQVKLAERDALAVTKIGS
jgi:hypothetical protein